MYIYYFICLSLFFSIMVFVTFNPVHSIFYLVGGFLSTSIVFILIDAEFVALVYLIVYLGAITVLFLFVCMMLNIRTYEGYWFSSYLVVASSFSLVLLFVLVTLSFSVENLVDCFFEDTIFRNFINTFMRYNGRSISHDVWLELFYVDWSYVSSYDFDNVSLLGFMFFNYYFFCLLLVGFLLLVTMVYCISVTLKYNDVQRQLINQQVVADPVMTVLN